MKSERAFSCHTTLLQSRWPLPSWTRFDSLSYKLKKLARLCGVFIIKLQSRNLLIKNDNNIAINTTTNDNVDSFFRGLEKGTVAAAGICQNNQLYNDYLPTYLCA